MKTKKNHLNKTLDQLPKKKTETKIRITICQNMNMSISKLTLEEECYKESISTFQEVTIVWKEEDKIDNTITIRMKNLMMFQTTQMFLMDPVNDQIILLTRGSPKKAIGRDREKMVDTKSLLSLRRENMVSTRKDDLLETTK